MDWRWVLPVLAIAGGLTGCGMESGPPRDGSDPLATGEAFVEALAAADPGACDLLTSTALDEIESMSGEPSCPRAVAAANDWLKDVLYGTSPAALDDELGEAELEEVTGGARFHLCTPDETAVKLELVEGEEGWEIDHFITSIETRVPAGAAAGGASAKRAPCVPGA